MQHGRGRLTYLDASISNDKGALAAGCEVSSMMMTMQASLALLDCMPCRSIDHLQLPNGMQPSQEWMQAWLHAAMTIMQAQLAEQEQESQAMGNGEEEKGLDQEFFDLLCSGAEEDSEDSWQQQTVTADDSAETPALVQGQGDSQRQQQWGSGGGFTYTNTANIAYSLARLDVQPSR